MSLPRALSRLANLLLSDRMIEAVRHYRAPKWRHENELDDEAARAIIRAAVLGQGGIMVDVGAHAGAILCAAVDAAPQVRHHAFEPGPISDRLSVQFPSVSVHTKCVGASECEVTFYEYRRATRNSTTFLAHEELTSRRTVGQLSLDSLLNDLAGVAVLKIDVEGGELDVLRGADQLLVTYRPIILFEHGAPGGGVLPHTDAIFELLTSYGYRISPVRGGYIGNLKEFRKTVGAGLSWNFLAVPSRPRTSFPVPPLSST